MRLRAVRSARAVALMQQAGNLVCVRPSMATTVAEVMAHNPATISADAPISEAARATCADDVGDVLSAGYQPSRATGRSA